MASIEGYNLVISYYFSSSEIWPDNRGGLWWEGPDSRGGLWWEGPDNRGGLWWEGSYTVQYKTGTNVSF